MEDKEILEALKETLKEELGFEPEDLTFSENDDIAVLGVDSFQMVEITYEIEKKLLIRIDNSELGKIKKVGELMKLIKTSGGIK